MIYVDLCDNCGKVVKLGNYAVCDVDEDLGTGIESLLICKDCLQEYERKRKALTDKVTALLEKC